MKITVQKMDELFTINNEDYVVVEEWTDTDYDVTMRECMLIKKSFYDDVLVPDNNFELNDLIMNSIKLRYATKIEDPDEKETVDISHVGYTPEQMGYDK